MTCTKFFVKRDSKSNDNVLEVVFIMFLGTYSTIFGGIKNLNKEN
jgi:hypothetical protein